MNNLIQQIRDFARERDWNQFHSPKNLAMALSVESSEIVEIFQWLTQKQSYNLVPDRKPPFSKKNRDSLKFGEEFYRKKYDMDDIHKINTISFKN